MSNAPSPTPRFRLACSTTFIVPGRWRRIMDEYAERSMEENEEWSNEASLVHGMIIQPGRG
jgi:hypothetical protein